MFDLLWFQLPLGRQCVEHYRSLNRYCVFSHDEMVCSIAAKADNLELELVSSIQNDMSVMILEEKELRGKAYKLVRHKRILKKYTSFHTRTCTKKRSVPHS